MFDRKTVFILGAGASWHYNYPTGEDLVQCIVDKAKELIIRLKTNGTNILWQGNLVKFLSENFGDGDFVDFLQNFIDRIEHVDPPVIDYFLDWNKDLRSIGQMIIAWVILDREREFEERLCNINRRRLSQQSPYPDENGRMVDCRKFKDNWYRFILYKMLSECASPEQVGRNNVHFVTFNYDVSLESYLYRGLKQIEFMKPGNIDVESFLQDKFSHMYGSIRDNPFVSDIPVIENTSDFHNDYKAYSAVLQKVYGASQGIRTIGNNKDDDTHKSVKEIIQGADDVYILGYGFDSNNNKRLGLDELLSVHGMNKLGRENKESIKRKVYFTNFGDSNSVNKKAAKIFVGNNKKFLQEYTYDIPYNIGQYSCSGAYEKSIRNVYDALERDFDFI